MNPTGDSRFTIEQLARRCAMPPRVVRRQAAAAGIEPDAAGKYSLKEFRQYLRTVPPAGRPVNGHHAELQARKLEAEARLLEMKIAEREGELVNIFEIADAVGRLVVACKSDLLAIGKRIAPELEGLTAGRIAERIERAVSDALRHLAKYDPDKEPR